jgi:glycosyltransferase involved in cell wall biosynthesis
MEDITWGWWENKGWKVVRQKNKYIGAARNSGVKQAAGKYIVFMDDDDIAKPHQVETFVKVAENRDAEIVTSGHDVFSGLKRPHTSKSLKRYLPIGPAKMAGMLENVFGDSKMLVRRDSFIAEGGFTEDYGVGFEDYELSII